MATKMIALLPDMLKRLRGDMTQAQLAAKAGVARATVIRLERSTRSPMPSASTPISS
jgi:transcriptional regulator with XRE-family HTH domain